jgi:hypothetical protein
MSSMLERPKGMKMTQSAVETTLQNEVDQIANQYFDLVYTNELAILDRIFDGNAHRYGKTEAGDVLLWPIARYRAVLASGQSPQQLGAPREQEILARDFASQKIGIGRTSDSEVMPITTNGFFGAARDRLPLSAIDPLDSPNW